ncbi:hypothetical protein [Sorangium sp. So ce1000]|uniref:hypothetical protein n=1 Tax=Sorangium sp. So ce1000 TaxID=3133325 RepID=UPI003F5D8BF8
MSTLTRDPGPLRLEGIRGADLRSLASDLTGAQGRLVVADMSLGSWRSHQIASELCAQLGLPEPDVGPPPAGGAGGPSSRIGRLIDSDTRGDRATADALRLATEVRDAVAAHAPTVFCVVVGPHDVPWEPGDALFVRFLAQALSATAHRLVLVTCAAQDPMLPSGFSASWSGAARIAPAAAVGDEQASWTLIPGVLTPDVIEALPLARGAAPFVPLPGGCSLVPPELRPDPRVVAPELYGRLAAAARQVPWIAAYAACQGSDGAIDPSFLWEHARREFEAGGAGIALRLLQRAIPLARSVPERGVFLLLAQALRIASGLFAQAAEAPDPDERSPAELRGWLWHTKGWALTMRERHAEAEACLERAREALRGTGLTEEYLYVMNISALNRLKLGDWEGALALEDTIRTALDGVTTGVWQLRYINSLNLGRLHRRRRDFEASERYYRDAFGTTFGARTDSDSIYLNVCLARLDDARGGHADAFRAWARAALHWASSPAPEAIAKRVVAAILAPPGDRTEGNPSDDVSATLTASLAESAAAAGMDREAALIRTVDPGAAAALLRPDALARERFASTRWHALRGPGGWVLGAEAESPPVVVSAANRRLRAALAALLAPTASPGAPAALRTIVVDDQLGRELPGSDAEILSVCLRLGVRTLIVDGHELDLDGALRARLESRLQVRIGAAVDRIDPERAVVTFKRYREPRRLPRVAAGVLRHIAEGDPAAQIARSGLISAAGSSAMAVLRSLEQDRIIELALPDDVTIPTLRGAAA